MQSMRRRVAVVIAAALGAVALTAGLVSAASAGSEAQSAKGGTYRVGWESTFGWSDSFDPTGEYLANFIAIYTNLLGRNLVGYNHVVGTAGNVPVPDLATAIPKPTNGGKTWTFRLKSGIRFGPPVNREITSSDIKYALERLADPKNGGQYAFYFNVIKGFEAVGKGEAQSVSGITTPNAKTIVFNLTKPTGDFPKRLGMPAAGPIPHEVADCFKGKPGEYGRFVISSGPYMIEGSQNLDIKSCDAMKPISGYDGKTSLVLVRNPELQREDGQHEGSREQSGPLRVHGRHQPRRHLQQDRGGRARGRVRNGVAEGLPGVLDGCEQAEVHQVELRRPDVLHHDEPDPAAVRRRARPPGDELGDGSQRTAQGVGRPDRRRDRGAHHARTP